MQLCCRQHKVFKTAGMRGSPSPSAGVWDRGFIPTASSTAPRTCPGKHSARWTHIFAKQTRNSTCCGLRGPKGANLMTRSVCGGRIGIYLTIRPRARLTPQVVIEQCKM